MTWGPTTELGLLLRLRDSVGHLSVAYCWQKKSAPIVVLEEYRNHYLQQSRSIHFRRQVAATRWIWTNNLHIGSQNHRGGDSHSPPGRSEVVTSTKFNMISSGLRRMDAKIPQKWCPCSWQNSPDFTWFLFKEKLQKLNHHIFGTTTAPSTSGSSSPQATSLGLRKRHRLAP